MSEKILRVIKSKAKELETNRWVYGTHLVLPSGKEFIVYVDDNDIYEMLNLTEVKPETVCHHFGSLDSTGSEIYTNDVLIGDMANDAGFGSKTKYNKASFVYKINYCDNYQTVESSLSIYTHPDFPKTYKYFPYIGDCIIQNNLFD